MTAVLFSSNLTQRELSRLGNSLQGEARPSGDAVGIARPVAEFNDGCVLSAASVAGVRRTRPGFGPRSAVSSAADTLLNQFADTLGGQWPLPDAANELCEELISGCVAEQVAIDRAELEKWLVVAAP